MIRRNFVLGGVKYDSGSYISPPLRFDGWLKGEGGVALPDEALVVSIADRSVVIPLERIGELIHYLEEWNHE